MISGAHMVIYSADAEADRAFFRDVLGFPLVDAGERMAHLRFAAGGNCLSPGGREWQARNLSHV